MNDMTIAGVTVRRDAEGRYSLNDLHRAAGGEDRHRPGQFTRTDTCRALVAELESAHIRAVSVEEGRGGGTFAAKELVYAYAMWISPAFNLQVIRAYDVQVTQPAADPMAALNDPAAMRGLLLTYTEKVLALEERVAEQAPKALFHDRVVASPGALDLGEAAKLLGTGRNRLAAQLRQMHWLTRFNEPYQDKIDAGLLDVKLSRFWEHPEQGLKRSVTAIVTGKGLARLRELGVGQNPRAVA